MDNRTDKIQRHKRNMKRDGRCERCPPHGGENANHDGRIRKHGVKKKRKAHKD